MSNFSSDQYTNFAATPPTKLRPDEIGGRERVLYCNYTTPASAGPAAGDTLVLFPLPAGARVVSMEVCVPASFVNSSAKIGYGALGGGGVATDDDRWGSGIDLSSVGRKQFLTVAADMDYRTTDQVDVILTFTTANPAASKQIAALCRYVVD